MYRDDMQAWLFWIVLLVVIGMGALYGIPGYDRYQAVLYAENAVKVANIQSQRTEQLVKVEQQKAQIRIVEAQGIARAQEIINATLTPQYLQHEAIQAQERAAGGNGRTEIYIPVGTNGIPLVRTVNPDGTTPAPRK